jgi:Domain of unknown function (DUF5911)
LIVAQVHLVTGGSVYAVTEELTASRSTLRGSPFSPIAEYGFLSDCQVSALVAASGTVEWMCLPRMDGPSVFAAILDRGAGWFRLGPADVTVPIRADEQRAARPRYRQAGASKAMTLLMPAGLPRIRSGACSGG